MLSIHSAAAAFPSTQISNTRLSHLFGQELPEAWNQPGAITQRNLVLPYRYLNLTKNSDPRIGEMVATVNPSELGAQAARIAIQRAGIELEEIGLVLGDCGTSIQPTPAEAQRVAGRLGLKVPAYDITGLSGAMALHLQNLTQWKLERVPRYVLCVYVNTPSVFTSYNSWEGGGFFFGDCAAALIVSIEVPARVQVESIKFSPPAPSMDSTGALMPALSINPQSLLSFKCEETCNYQSSSLTQILSDLDVDKRSSIKIIGSEFDIQAAKRICLELGISESQYVNVAASHGHSLSSTVVAGLAEIWETLQDQDAILLSSTIPGLSTGLVNLKVEESVF